MPSGAGGSSANGRSAGPGAGGFGFRGTGFGGGAGARGGGFGGMGGSGWLKLLGGRFAPQIGWLYPFAFAALAFGFWWRRRAGRTDRLRGGFVMWGGWLAVVGLVFSDMSSIPHTAYLSTLAPALAALAGTGGVMMWDAYRKGARSGWALPVALAVETAWTWHLSASETGFLPWLRWLALVAGVVGLFAMVWGKVSRRARGRLLVAGLLTGLAGAVVTPVAWASSVLDTKYAGSAFDAGAGPTALGGTGMPAAIAERFGGRAGSGSPGGFTGPGGAISTTLTADQRRLYDYVKSRQGGAKYVLATDGWSAASPYILATGDTVMPMGGFSGSVPQPTPAAFESLVRTGGVRYVLTSGGAGRGFAGMGGGGSVTRIDAWVKKECAAVPSSAYGVERATGSSAARGPFGMFGAGGGTLYDCAPSS